MYIDIYDYFVPPDITCSADIDLIQFFARTEDNFYLCGLSGRNPETHIMEMYSIFNHERWDEFYDEDFSESEVCTRIEISSTLVNALFQFRTGQLETIDKPFLFLVPGGMQGDNE